MQLEDDSLWESFPKILETLDGAKRYINAFRAPLQELNNLKSEQVHGLRACSGLAIPSVMERMPPPGGFPKDLSELNLSSWAGLIQDVVQGLQAVPPNLNLEVCLTTMVLLQLLEATTGVSVKLPSDKAAPMAGQPTQDRGRQQTTGQGDRGQSASHPRDARGTTSNVPSTATSGALQSQQGGRAKGKRPDPALLAAGGRKTLSTCSRSTVSTTYKPPIGRLNR